MPAQQQRAPRTEIGFEEHDVWDHYDRVCQAAEAEARTNAFYDQITGSEHVGVTELAPHVTILPDLGMSLAERCDTENFGLKQVLYGVIRAGNHGFALITAYGTGRMLHSRKPGRTFITKINEEPYLASTKFISRVLPHTSEEVILGGPSKLAPELAEDGAHFIVSADRKGTIKLQARTLGKLPFQLITPTRPLSQRPEGEYNPLLDEVGIWAPPPAFVKHKLNLH